MLIAQHLREVLHRFGRRCEAATSAEYALLIAMIAVVIVVAVAFFGRAVVGLFETYPELISS
ncbi:MAG: Flp family type IVb pilin [Acidimicrobiia bacterium]